MFFQPHSGCFRSLTKIKLSLELHITCVFPLELVQTLSDAFGVVFVVGQDGGFLFDAPTDAVTGHGLSWRAGVDSLCGNLRVRQKAYAERMHPAKLVSVIFFAVGIVLLVAFAVVHQGERRFISQSQGAQGTVVELVLDHSTRSTGSGSSRRLRSSNVYKPLVRFQTRDGEAVEFLSSTGSNPPAYSAGDRVEVRYRPDFPERAKLVGFWSLWLGSFILGILSLAFTAIGASLLIFVRRS